MLDLKFIRENPTVVKENIKKKFQDSKLELVDELISLDKEWRETKQKADSLRHERNTLTLEITKLKKAGKDVSQVIRKAQTIPQEIKNLEEKEVELETKIKELQMQIPNIIHKSVPIGKDSNENVEIRKVGTPKIPKFEILNHAELAEKIKGVDFDSARDISGNGFYFLRGDLALLHSAILAFARDYMVKQGFEYIIPPFMIRRKVVNGVMSFKEVENMMYKVEGEDLYLIGTSEHSMIGRFINKTISKRDVPLKLTSYSPCFRKEVGSHGIEEKGFYRLHQFEKQEMIVICEPEESYKIYNNMMKYSIEVFRALNVPIRILECCSGDLADLKAKSCDTEAWSPRQKRYYEVGSLTNMEEAQARRLNIKIQGSGNNYFAHTLNNTVLASPRALIAVMENNQNKDGSITVPKVLVKYMGGKKVIGKPTGGKKNVRR